VCVDRLTKPAEGGLAVRRRWAGEWPCCSEARGGEGAVHEQLHQAGAAVPHVEGAGEGAAAGDGAGIGPGAIKGGEGVTGVAGDQ